jgi:hypothetical protein
MRQVCFRATLPALRAWETGSGGGGHFEPPNGGLSLDGITTSALTYSTVVRDFSLYLNVHLAEMASRMGGKIQSVPPKISYLMLLTGTY